MNVYDKLRKILESLGVDKSEALGKAIGHLSDKEKIDFFTNLVYGEDETFAVKRTIAQRYNLSWLKFNTENHLTLRTSVNGWRSNQIVAIAQEKTKEKRLGFLARLFRRGEKEEEKGLEGLE